MANTSNRRIPDRAMQFAPFAALKGYYETVRMQERIHMQLPQEVESIL